MPHPRQASVPAQLPESSAAAAPLEPKQAEIDLAAVLMWVVHEFVTAVFCKLHAMLACMTLGLTQRQCREMTEILKEER